ncbi:E3 ubiquitin-protein ligase RNF31 isoform X2 [Genypterus blacodes]|uniref:E3 ubiquitin-protein ligase RNF31 isoform X2 n=1 Tax=Genypterus blacodes TaxID=154954 RepID=UPI003F75B8F5
MPQVEAGAELQTLIECRYRFTVETLSDLQIVRSVFSDLRLYVDFYCFPNGEKKKLLYLCGTVPVTFEGSDYNIPVCIWLHQSHPVTRPRCYVCPSVSMVINPSCPCVDASGNIRLGGLSKWTKDVSSLSLLVSEMRQAFQKEAPLYATPSVSATHTPAGISGVQVLERARPSATSQSPSTSGQSGRLSLTSPQTGLTASQWEQANEGKVRRSYTEELLEIDFSAAAPPSSSSSSSNNSNAFMSSSPRETLSRMMGTLSLDAEVSRGSEPGPGQFQGQRTVPQPATGQDWSAVTAHLPLEKAAMFLQLLGLEQNFNTADVLEAVQLNRDFPSALKFLSHSCPICQEQVSFSKIITMTHCSCCLCVSCFKSFFMLAILERSVDQLVCPQCGRPEVRGQGGMEEAMDYFNLLDTQIRHFLSPQIHELFQRKLRDRALQEMKNFCWCAHCSFGLLHEDDTLRMDCPSCKKSSCSQCRSAWSPQHQGVSCQQFRAWKQKNQPEQNSLLSYNSIECPRCHFIFILSNGGCLHFTCSQCEQEFCGGCSQSFTQGSACGFSMDCETKGLHAHHPRDCLYYLRDWSVSRLQLLLQRYRVSPSWLGTANRSSGGLEGVCSVLELRDVCSRREEPCGRPAPAQYRGYCQLHYKEHLVELINRCCADPAVLFSPAEIMAELRRWRVTVPTRKPEEPEPLYARRLQLTLANSAPLRKELLSSVKIKDDLCPPISGVTTIPGATPPRLLL